MRPCRNYPALHLPLLSPDSHFPTQEGVQQINMSPASESSHWEYEFHSPTALALPTSMNESLTTPPHLGLEGIGDTS